jgi:hypothetical protein
MSAPSDTRAASDAELTATFRELRALLDAHAKRQAPLARRGDEEGPITMAHLLQLKSDISNLIRSEGARGSRSSYMANAVFYALGVATTLLIDFIRTRGLFW